MSKHQDMPDQVAILFERFADAMDKQSGQRVAAFYHLPAIIMNDDEKMVYAERQKLTERTSQTLELFRLAGIVHHHAKVTHVMRLSEAIWFCTVDWELCDTNHEVVEKCMTSHTLQHNGELEIIVSVIDENIMRLLQVARQRSKA